MYIYHTAVFRKSNLIKAREPRLQLYLLYLPIDI